MKYILAIILSGTITGISFAQVPTLNLIQMAVGFTKPIDLKNCGDERLFVIEQAGYIRVLSKNGVKQTLPFLDIHTRVQSTGNEQGLLSLAFSPNYKQDGFFYVNYINGSGAGSTRISRFSVMANDSSQANPNSEVILLTFTQPYANHNGSTVMFGPDGYLYVTQGDGGLGGDPQDNGQDKSSYLGKILRLDVTGQATYVIPPSNPFVGVTNAYPEIWAYGLRNPWRCSFDRITGDLWIGDVGQDAYEEVDFQNANSTGGENYGWRCREGFHAYNMSGCASTGFTEPIFEMAQANSTVCSVTGGYVYRGAQYSKLFGYYFHSDYCSGRIWRTKKTGTNSYVVDSPVVRVNGALGFLTATTSFGEDNQGELYICSTTGGSIFHITETTNCNPVAFISLKDTLDGCSPVKISALRGDTLSYQWYDINGPINGGSSFQYETRQSGWYKVKVSKQQIGCEAMSDSIFVNVYDSTALVKNIVDTIYCINDAPISLNAFFNTGPGIFSGNGVSNNDSIFAPASAGAGSSVIQYQFTNNDGCISHSSFDLVVGDRTSLSENIVDSIYCNNEAAFSLNGLVQPASGTFSGPGVTSNNFDPTVPAIGVTTISYTYINNFGCVSTDSINLRVDDCTDLDELNNDLSFNIFPNPNRGKFTIAVKLNTSGPTELTVCDQQGKICFRKTQFVSPDRSLIQVEYPFAKGIYRVKLTGENGNAQKSLVIE